jgi:hypothetical protein
VAAGNRNDDIEGLRDARDLLRDGVLGPDVITDALGAPLSQLLSTEEHARIRRVPFDRPTLQKAAATGALLVLRIPRDRTGPLSILRLSEAFPTAFTAKGLTDGVGYQLRSEWTAAAQAFATDAPELGWRLVTADPAPETLGRPHAQQTGALATFAERLGMPTSRARRRTAVDAAYDLALAFAGGKRRLLATTWDWTRTETTDGAFVTVGSFGPGGLQILAYSAAVRFASLGMCPEVF